jgi:hypothetical protein
MFDDQFLLAVNNGLVLFAIALDRTGAIAEVDQIDAVINLDVHYRPLIEAYIDYYLLAYGIFRSGEFTFKEARDRVDDQETKARTYRDQLAERAATDGNVIGEWPPAVTDE